MQRYLSPLILSASLALISACSGTGDESSSAQSAFNTSSATQNSSASLTSSHSSSIHLSSSQPSSVIAASSSTALSSSSSGPNLPSDNRGFFIQPFAGVLYLVDQEFAANVEFDYDTDNITEVTLTVNGAPVRPEKNASYDWKYADYSSELILGTNIFIAEAQLADGSVITIGTSIEIVTSLPTPSSMAFSSASVVTIELADLTQGQNQYTLQCENCHGDTGQGSAAGPAINPNAVSYSHPSQLNKALTLAEYTERFMPPNKASLCGPQCAFNIGGYIENNFSTALIIADEEEAKARSNSGLEFYQSTYCVTCHGADGRINVGAGYNLFNCPSCTSWQNLRNVISQTMPKASESSGPENCTGECADRITDWIWADVNSWTLTQNGGIRPIRANVNQGFNTRRIKSYDAILEEFKRVFGQVPEPLRDARSAFPKAPDYWYKPDQLSAVTLNILTNAAVLSCQSQQEQMPHLQEDSVREKCNEWANRMWLRDGNKEELDSCVHTAMEVTKTMSGGERARLEFTCASMMLSMPVLTY